MVRTDAASLRSAATILLLLGAGTAAQANDDTSTVNGLTFYGAIDVGVSFDTHGAPSTTYGNTGSDYLVQKQSNRAVWNLAQSGMGQSKIGLKGAEDMGDDWTAPFKLETAINPTGGNVTDALKSLTSNNGRSLQSWNAAADSSRGANAFAGAAYAGVSNPVYGTLTMGRQTTLQNDLVAAYDPLYNSYAFSLIGFSGTGAGATQYTRWDDSAKYLVSYGPPRAGLMYAFGGSLGRDDTGYSADLGSDEGGLSVDATYTHKNDEVNASPLSAAQVLTAGTLGYSGSDSLAFSVHDDDAYSVAARYYLGRYKFFAGFEYIETSNPGSPPPAGFTDMGYTAAFVNNAAFPKTRELIYAWRGARYAVTPKFEVAGGYYYVHQNAYGTGASAGYTATIVGFATVSHPERVFDVAVARVEEIVLGIVCATLTRSLLFPRSVALPLKDRLTGALADRRHLIADLSDIHQLSMLLPWDTSALRTASGTAETIRQRLLMLIPILSGIEDRMTALSERPDGIDDGAASATAAVAHWLEGGSDYRAGKALERAIEDRMAGNLRGDWNALLRHSLLTRLQDLVSTLSEANFHMAALSLTPPPPRTPDTRDGRCTGMSAWRRGPACRPP